MWSRSRCLEILIYAKGQIGKSSDNCNAGATSTSCHENRSVAALFTLDHSIRTSPLPKHLIQIIHQSLRPLMRSKMPTVRMLALEHHRSQRPAPAFRRDVEILGEVRESELDVRDVPPEPGAVGVRRVSHFVVDPRAGRGPGGREPVDRDPGQDLVVGPGVRVGPVVELFVDPGEQGGGAVG